MTTMTMMVDIDLMMQRRVLVSLFFLYSDICYTKIIHSYLV
jgi:hypothetical protein